MFFHQKIIFRSPVTPVAFIRRSGSVRSTTTPRSGRFCWVPIASSLRSHNDRWRRHDVHGVSRTSASRLWQLHGDSVATLLRPVYCVLFLMKKYYIYILWWPWSNMWLKCAWPTRGKTIFDSCQARLRRGRDPAGTLILVISIIKFYCVLSAFIACLVGLCYIPATTMTTPNFGVYFEHVQNSRRSSATSGVLGVSVATYVVLSTMSRRSWRKVWRGYKPISQIAHKILRSLLVWLTTMNFTIC